MEEINRLHDIADDIGSTSWGYELASALHNIAADIGEKVDEMRHVLAADDKPLEVGQRVWNINNGMEFTVSRLPKPGEYQAVKVRYRNGSSTSFDPDQLTHQRPEVDSWSRLEEDAKLSLCEYNLRHKPAVGDGTTLGEDVRVDLVRRCKALAERERCE